MGCLRIENRDHAIDSFILFYLRCCVVWYVLESGLHKIFMGTFGKLCG